MERMDLMSESIHACLQAHTVANVHGLQLTVIGALIIVPID